MSRSAVTVHVNRGESETLEAATTSLETRGSFELVLLGHDGPAHVHCRLEGDLAAVAGLAQPNYYAEPATETTVPVEVADLDGPVAGRLEVSTGYGAETVSIDVTVRPGPRVDVDETLAEPRRREPEPTLADRIPVASDIDPGTLGVVALAAVALGVAALSAAVVGGTAAFVAFLIVTAGVGVAVALLIA